MLIAGQCGLFSSTAIAILRWAPEKRGGGPAVIMVPSFVDALRQISTLCSCSVSRSSSTKRRLGNFMLPWGSWRSVGDYASNWMIQFRQQFKFVYLLLNWTYRGRQCHFEHRKRVGGVLIPSVVSLLRYMPGLALCLPHFIRFVRLVGLNARAVVSWLCLLRRNSCVTLIWIPVNSPAKVLSEILLWSTIPS